MLPRTFECNWPFGVRAFGTFKDGTRGTKLASAVCCFLWVAWEMPMRITSNLFNRGLARRQPHLLGVNHTYKAPGKTYPLLLCNCKKRQKERKKERKKARRKQENKNARKKGRKKERKKGNKKERKERKSGRKKLRSFAIALCHAYFFQHVQLEWMSLFDTVFVCGLHLSTCAAFCGMLAACWLRLLAFQRIFAIFCSDVIHVRNCPCPLQHVGVL